MVRDRKAYRAAYRAANLEKVRAQAHAYYSDHKDRFDQYRLTHKENTAGYKAKFKAMVMDAYGGPVCSCCGETLLAGLTIDHVAGDGAEHRKTMHEDMYRWLYKRGYPPGYQVLCMTCNLAKGKSDHCPHQDMRAMYEYAPY